MRLSCALCLCCLALQVALTAESNLTLTVDGITYSNVTFGTATPSYVGIFHSAGVASIPLEKLPPDLQKRFGYDPQKAAAYAKQQEEAAAAYAEQQEENRKHDAELLQKLKDAPLDALPFSGDETPLVAIKADPQKYIGKPVTVVGCVEISNYYNFNYSEAGDKYYSLSFQELDKAANRTTESLSLYLSRVVGKPLIDRLVKRSGKCVAIRMQVSITGRSFSYGQYDEMAEVVNWATLSADRQSWKKWELANPKK